MIGENSAARECVSTDETLDCVLGQSKHPCPRSIQNLRKPKAILQTDCADNQTMDDFSCRSEPWKDRFIRTDSVSLTQIQALERQAPLPAAAASLGMTPSELRRACRRLGIDRWRFRAHAAAAAAAAAPESRAVAYVANLRRRYGGSS